MVGREKLVELLAKCFTIGDSYAYNLTRVKEAFAIGTMDLDDFVEFDDETVEDIADHLLHNGVTVQEWISVKDGLPENDTYVNVVTDGVVVQAYWHNDRFYAFTAIGVATVGAVTHWMPLPPAPKEVK